MSLLRRHWPWVLLALGALIPLLRVLADPLGTLPGVEGGDIYKHTWSYWHTLAQLREGTWPHTRFLNGPGGGEFLDLMLLPSLLMAPVSLLLGPVAAANTWVWVSLLAVGGATYLLAMALTGSREGAVTAGLIAQTAPYLLGYPLASGVHERLAVWVFPLVVLALLRVREGRWRWALIGGAGLLFATSGCAVYGVFSIAMSLLLAPLWLHGITWRRFTRLAVTALAWGLALAGLFLLVRGLAYSDQALSPQLGRADLSWGIKQGHMDTSSLGLLLGPGTTASQPARLIGDELWMVTYLGWVPLLAALIGAALAPAKHARATWLIVLAGLGMALVSVGSVIQTTVLNLANLLYMGLCYLIPTFGTVDTIWQAAAASTPLLGVGIAALIAWLPRWRLGAGLALLALVLVERALVSPVPFVAWTTDAHVPAIYEAVDGDGTLLELPRVWKGKPLSRGILFLAQTVHHQPITASINIGVNTWDQDRTTLLGHSSDWPSQAKRWREGGLRWVMVHRDWFERDPEAAVVGLQEVLGAPVADDGTRALFDLSVLPVRPGPGSPPVTDRPMPGFLMRTTR